MSRLKTIRALDAQHTAGLDASAAAASLNAEVTVSEPVPYDKFTAYLYDTGLFDRILIAAGEGNATASGVIAKLDYAIKFGLHRIDLQKPATVASLSALVTAGLVTQEEIDNAVKLGGRVSTLAAEAGIEPVTSADIEFARKQLGAHEVAI